MVHLDLPHSAPKRRRNCRVTRKESISDGELIDRQASYDDLLKLVDQSPLHVAHSMRQRLSRSRAEHEAELLDGCRLAYAAAIVLKKRTIMWSRLVQDPFWQEYQGHKPRMGKIGDHLKWLLVLFFDPRDDLAKERVNTYRGALQPLFDDGGDTSEIAEYVKANGGFDDLYTKHRGENNVSAAPKVQDHGDSAGADPTLPVPQSPSTEAAVLINASGTAPESKGKARSTTKPQSEHGKRDKEWAKNLIQRAIMIENAGYRAVLVHMKQSHLDKVQSHYRRAGKVILDCSLPDNDPEWLDIFCRDLMP